jgi:hypothetical protein
MRFRWLAAGAMIMLSLSGGGAFAQLSDSQDSVYSDPVLPDPPLKPAYIFSPALATADVAAVTPEGGSATPAGGAKTSSGAKTPQVACNALNPCALVTPARS